MEKQEFAELKSTIRQFMRTRPNEEIKRVAESKPERFSFMQPSWLNNRGCLICHMIDNYGDGDNKFCLGENAYRKFKREIKDASKAEFAYMTIAERTSNIIAGTISIHLANEVLGERQPYR